MSMEYRKLPHGAERIGTLGVGTGGLHNAPEAEIEAVVDRAIGAGVNFFDLCAGGASVYRPFGRAMKGRREQVLFQLHFGAVYNEKGEYGWSRDRAEIARTFEWELEALQTDYADFGFLHCVDEESDLRDILKNGILDLVRKLKEEGRLRHLGFSSHTPAVARKLLDLGGFDMMMFSLNPAYDFERGDEYGIGSARERADLLRRCQAEGVGVSVMKPFHGGQLLSAETSPFKRALTREQCLRYCLDRPAVLTVVPGVRDLADLEALLGFPDCPKEAQDYSVIAQFTPADAAGSCVYCNHCQPCPAGIDIGLVNKYYDLAQAGDRMAADHYGKLEIKAGACLACGHCDRRCPFGVRQQEKMQKIAACFGS